MKDVLLINLCSYPQYTVGPVFPIGLVKIKSHLEKNNYTCDILDYNQEPILDIDNILEQPYKVIGVSIRNIDSIELDSKVIYNKYVQFINELYKKKMQYQKTFKLVVGGSGYSLYNSQINALINFDYGIIGNGEDVFLKLLTEQNLPKIIFSRESSMETILYDSELVKAYLKLSPEMYIGIQTYDGQCLQNCIYCSYNYKSMPFKMKPIENIIEEIKQLRKLSVKNLFIIDSVFNRTDEYAINVLKGIVNYVQGMNIAAFLNPSNNSQLYYYLKECNIYAIYSFDSFSEKILISLNKGFNKNDVYKTIENCRKFSIEFNSNIIVGALGENEKTIYETCEFANTFLDKKSELVTSFGIRIIPHSFLFEKIANARINYLEPTFLYFPKQCFEYYYHFIDKKFIDVRRFLKHLSLKNNYSKIQFVSLESKYE